ncbi:hypothetical protein M9H77_13557 [Catharanthus roseus]|uniref:Uncharacterized protein n=1 Tax=Catharanthus roseus TaxID=4058 RepID=A0ACC0BKR2_CATRO|nr:hypothetical protein M9H77_13557 [Catharanthus roseus]
MLVRIPTHKRSEGQPTSKPTIIKKERKRNREKTALGKKAAAEIRKRKSAAKAKIEKKSAKKKEIKEGNKNLEGRRCAIALKEEKQHKKKRSCGGDSSSCDHSTRSAFRLHCTWLVPRTRASSDDVDGFLTLRWIHLKRGVVPGGRGPIEAALMCLIRSDFLAELKSLILTQDGQGYNKPLNLVPRGTQMPYSAAVDLVAGLGIPKFQYPQVSPHVLPVLSFLH